MILILIIYAILIYLYVHTFYYLKKAENTGCFTPKVNLKYMQFFQLLEIVALTMTVLFFPYFIKMKKKKSLGLLEPFLVTLVVLGINAYMALNVYNFYFELQNCFELKQQWNNWWLYWEGIASGVSAVRGVLSLTVIVLLLLQLK